MNNIEVRDKIINQLSYIEDDNFLIEIMNLVDGKAKSEIHQLSQLQKDRVGNGRNSFKEGKTISDDELQNDVKEWFNLK